MSENRANSQKIPDASLPLRGSADAPRRVILASHLVFTGYAHWLPNDLRGSGSDEIRSNVLKPLGEILPGRQFPQPSREEVREFHREAQARLEHAPLWFDDSMRQTIGAAFMRTAPTHGYTLWACAVCSNHAHVIARTHRDRSEVIWGNLARGARVALSNPQLVAENHPVWSHRIYKVFLYTEDDVRGRIKYVTDNPVKEGLPRQHWLGLTPWSAKGKR
jgi:REP element-mobilizing transposase RayT